MRFLRMRTQSDSVYCAVAMATNTDYPAIRKHLKNHYPVVPIVRIALNKYDDKPWSSKLIILPESTDDGPTLNFLMNTMKAYVDWGFRRTADTLALLRVADHEPYRWIYIADRVIYDPALLRPKTLQTYFRAEVLGFCQKAE